jgi:hypothetical protein
MFWNTDGNRSEEIVFSCLKFREAMAFRGETPSFFETLGVPKRLEHGFRGRIAFGTPVCRRFAPQ